MTNTAAVFPLPWATGRMIITGSGPTPFDANIHPVATLTVTCDANWRPQVERFGTELAGIASERLASARRCDLDDRAYPACRQLLPGKIVEAKDAAAHFHVSCKAACPHTPSCWHERELV